MHPAATDIPEDYRHARLLVYILLAYFAAFLFLNLFRLWGFGFSIVDLGTYDQWLWNLTHGAEHRPSFTTNYPYDPNANWFGSHFSALILLFVAPLYYLFPHPELLEILHVAAMTLAAVPIYCACRILSGNSRTALLWACVFLLNPMQLFAIIYSFQDLSLATPIMATALWAVVAKRLRVLILCCILVLLAKEHFGVAVAGFGLLWGWRHRDWKTGAALIALGLAAFALLVLFVMPHFSGRGINYMLNPATMPSGLSFNRYQWLGLPLPEMVGKAQGFLFTYVMARFLFYQFAPVLLLCFASPVLLLPAMADLALILLSENDVPRMLAVYYSSCITPALVVAACAGALKFPVRLRRMALPVMALVQLGFAWDALRYLPQSLPLLTSPVMVWSFDPKVQKLKEVVGEDAPLIVSEELGPLFSRRREIYPLGAGVNPDDLIVLRLNPFCFRPTNAPYRVAPLPTLEALVDSPEWGIVYWGDPFLVLKHGAEDASPREELRARLRLLGAAAGNTSPHKE